MTKFLEQVLAEVRKLSDEEQDRIAAELMAHLDTGGDDHDLQLSDEQLAEVRRRRTDPNPRNMTIEQVDARIRRSPDEACYPGCRGGGPGVHLCARYSPRAADAIVERLLHRMRRLLDPGMARIGRPGREDGTRELVERPYIIVDEVDSANEEILIIAVVHGRQNR